MPMFVKTIKHSISPQGIELYTCHAHYWRPIHSELMTHRDFGRNARSSRAVPTMTLLQEEIFVPQFGMNKPGMQSDLLAPLELQDKWSKEWQDLAHICRSYVSRWSAEGMHKQHANRPLEWFGWIDVLITATRWKNFFALRISEFAQPEFDELARAISREMHTSSPKILLPGEWHLPYVEDNELAELGLETCKKLSVARCARLSYVPFDGEPQLDKEFERYEKLVVSQPVHASPAEHQATPDTLLGDNAAEYRWESPDLHGNLDGWIQLRKTIPNEVIR